jgi:hypothetical protein
VDSVGQSNIKKRSEELGQSITVSIRPKGELFRDILKVKGEMNKKKTEKNMKRE